MAQPAHEGHDPLLSGSAGLGSGGWAGQPWEPHHSAISQGRPSLVNLMNPPFPREPLPWEASWIRHLPGSPFPGKPHDPPSPRDALPWEVFFSPVSQGGLTLSSGKIRARDSPRNRATHEFRARGMSHRGRRIFPRFAINSKKRLCPNDPSFGHSLIPIHQQLPIENPPLFFFLGGGSRLIFRGVDQLMATIGAELGRGILQALSAVGAVGFNCLRFFCSTI